MLHSQFGGQSNTSCLDAALSLQHNILEVRRKGLVSSFLAMDVQGFFDHVNHDQMIHVLWKKGFPREICEWVKSFLSNYNIWVHLDNYTSPQLDLKVGVPQGSPISPSLTCLYASKILEHFNANPILSGLDIPCGAQAYINDFGFLISNSLHNNMVVLKASMSKAVALFSSISMSLDPDKSDLMHFSWKVVSQTQELLTKIHTICVKIRDMKRTSQKQYIKTPFKGWGKDSPQTTDRYCNSPPHKEEEQDGKPDCSHTASTSPFPSSPPIGNSCT